MGLKTIRSLPHADRKVLYLTFDDGPHPGATESVLELLARQEVSATFFVIAEKAARHSPLLQRTQSEGHTIGNHSQDHGYSRFFRGRRALRDWIELAESGISGLLGESTVGFRPPAGVRTPELHGALRDLKIPLILWNTRFFDTSLGWTRARALHSLKRARSGDIVLLHDRQTSAKLPGFLETLEAYISGAKQAGFEFSALTRAEIENNPHAG